jgi:hypothetical protein
MQMNVLLNGFDSSTGIQPFFKLPDHKKLVAPFLVKIPKRAKNFARGFRVMSFFHCVFLCGIGQGRVYSEDIAAASRLACVESASYRVCGKTQSQQKVQE